MVTEDPVEGVKALATGQGVTTTLLQITAPVQAALDAHLAEDADPAWLLSDSPHARPKVVLSEEGWLIAKEHGWTFVCGCRVCAKEGLIRDRYEVRGVTYGRCCSAVVVQYGTKDGSCRAHSRQAEKERV